MTAGVTGVVLTPAMMFVAERNGFKVRPLFGLTVDVMHLSWREHVELTVADTAAKLSDVIHPFLINRIRAASFHVP